MLLLLALMSEAQNLVTVDLPDADILDKSVQLSRSIHEGQVTASKKCLLQDWLAHHCLIELWVPDPMDPVSYSQLLRGRAQGLPAPPLERVKSPYKGENIARTLLPPVTLEQQLLQTRLVYDLRKVRPLSRRIHH